MIAIQPKADIRTTFNIQRRHAPEMALTTADQHIERIRRVQSWIGSSL